MEKIRRILRVLFQNSKIGNDRICTKQSQHSIRAARHTYAN